MGYTKTDELSINTIRVLAVSPYVYLHFTPLWLLWLWWWYLLCLVAVEEGQTANLHHRHASMHPNQLPFQETFQNVQLLTSSSPLGRCDRPCQLGSPRCPYVRQCSPSARRSRQNTAQ